MVAEIFVGVEENLGRGLGRRWGWWSLRGSREMAEEEEKEERGLDERRGERGLGVEERSFVRLNVVAAAAAIAAGSV